MKIAYLIFFILSFSWLLYKKKEFIIWLPLFYIIYETSFNYFTTLSIVTYIRPLLFAILLAYYYKKITLNFVTRPLFRFLLYTLLLIPFSSEFFYSLKGYMQVFISMMCLVIGYIYFDRKTKLDLLNKIALGVLLFTIFSSIMGYFFGIGAQLEYTVKKGPETIGLLRSFGLYSGAVIIGILPLVVTSFQKSFGRWLLFGTAIITYIFILLNVRRTAIVIPLIGLLTYLWFIPNKKKIISGLVIGIGVLLLLSPYYEKTLLRRFEIRENAGRFEEDFYETESRYIENINVFEKVFSFDNPIKSFFGSKIYASGREGDSRTRMNHTDLANLLDGTGIIGVILYVLLYFQLFKAPKRIKVRLNRNFDLYKSTYYGLLFISIFASIGGSLMNVTLRSILFLYMGAMLSMMKMVKLDFVVNNKLLMKSANYVKSGIL